MRENVGLHVFMIIYLLNEYKASKRCYVHSYEILFIVGLRKVITGNPMTLFNSQRIEAV